MAGQNQAPNVNLFDVYFRRADLDHDGRISGAEAVSFFQGSNLPKLVLAQVYSLEDGPVHVVWTNIGVPVTVLQNNNKPEIAAAFNSSSNDPEALRAIDLLYDTALISSGFTPDNPAQLGGEIYEMMDMALSGKWMAPAVEVQEIADQPGRSGNVEATEAEVVEPVEVDGRK